MTILTVMLIVGGGSYLLRAVPLLLVDRVNLSPRMERVLSDAVLAALASLLTTAVVAVAHGSGAAGVSPVAMWTALATGSAVALSGRSMASVAVAGMATAIGVIAVTSVV
jgi:branched-subunit amino acid transport protein